MYVVVATETVPNVKKTCPLLLRFEKTRQAILQSICLPSNPRSRRFGLLGLGLGKSGRNGNVKLPPQPKRPKQNPKVFLKKSKSKSKSKRNKRPDSLLGTDKIEKHHLKKTRRPFAPQPPQTPNPFPFLSLFVPGPRE